MIFFSGFSLANEEGIFEAYLKRYAENPHVVAGFSYGAIKAVEYALSTDRRIDRLILLSPAYFAGRPESFVKMQCIHYRKNPAAYIEKFFENAAFPASFDLVPFFREATPDDLEKLLRYEWDVEKMRALERRNIRIETYLGERDRIVDASAAHSFFKEYTTSYLFKPFGHLLR